MRAVRFQMFGHATPSFLRCARRKLPLVVQPGWLYHSGLLLPRFTSLFGVLCTLRFAAEFLLLLLSMLDASTSLLGSLCNPRRYCQLPCPRNDQQKLPFIALHILALVSNRPSIPHHCFHSYLIESLHTMPTHLLYLLYAGALPFESQRYIWVSKMSIVPGMIFLAYSLLILDNT